MNTQSQKTEEIEDSYENSLQHLQEELKRIDLLIFLQIQSLREERLKAPPNEYMGLFISEEEIDEILEEKNILNRENDSSASSKVATENIDRFLQTLQSDIPQKTTASLDKGIYLPLMHLSYLYNLTPFEIDCILICLAPELDLKYERLYAYLNNDVTKKKATVSLALKLLCQSLEEETESRTFFSAQAPLFKNHLLDFFGEQQDMQSPLIARSLKLDDRIVNFLLEAREIDGRLKRIVTIVEPQERLSELIVAEEVNERVSHLFRRLAKGKGKKTALPHLTRSVFYLKGPYNNSQYETASAICKEQDLLLLVVDTESLPVEDISFESALNLILREALFQTAAVYFKSFDQVLEDGDKSNSKEKLFLKAINEFHGLTFLEGERDWKPPFQMVPPSFFTLDFPVPPYSIRKDLWESHLKGHHNEKELDIPALANKFQFTRGQIADAVGTAINHSLSKGSRNSHSMEDIYEGCRLASNQKLSTLARKIEPRYGWTDIVLPEEKHNQLKDISSYVKYRNIVYGDWGFDKKLSLGKGLNALFHGPSGTGKTMAAEVVAKELALDLYKIDLSCVVSKYIGETEKNLNKIFKEAETSNAILFFDEADAIFGKRSEVKDAHDRYANIEVAYLLQKMEEYDGIVILATNLLKNMDDAFVRRIHFSVEFPFPNDESRLRIWKSIFPEEAPRDEDLDYEFLARKFKLSGGNIKNIVLSSAFFAAENSGKIKMKHIIMSTKKEFHKMGKLCMESDFGKYRNLIKK